MEQYQVSVAGVSLDAAYQSRDRAIASAKQYTDDDVDPCDVAVYMLRVNGSTAMRCRVWPSTGPCYYSHMHAPKVAIKPQEVDQTLPLLNPDLDS